MQIHIVSSLRSDLSSEKVCRISWGQAMARVILRRLDQMKAAATLEDTKNLPGKYHELSGSRKGQLAVHLVEPWRMVFVPYGDAEIFFVKNSLVWSKVTEVEITEIIDYH